jgi:hypothetical protein
MARDVGLHHPSDGAGAVLARRRADARERAVLPFFVVAFVWSWALWWTAAATGRSFAEPVGFMLYMTDPNETEW